ncbi:MAG: hypothetical protein JNK05_04335 [Myxococcales bacterium]|nr:hypothetical protein [Myxococcales bacterium]
MTHPAEALALEDRISYLRAVAALVSVDSDIDASELDAIHVLADSLHVDKSALDVDAFAKDPDISLVEEALSKVELAGLGHALLTDAITIAFADGEVDPDESKVIAHYAHRLHVPIAQAGILARFVAQAHDAKEAHALESELIAGIEAAEKVQSPGRIRAFIDRLRGRKG